MRWIILTNLTVGDMSSDEAVQKLDSVTENVINVDQILASTCRSIQVCIHRAFKFGG